MKLSFTILAAVPLLACAGALSAKEPAAPPAPANPNMEAAQELAARLEDVKRRISGMETLRQEQEYPRAMPPRGHVYLLRLDRGIEVVTESHTEDDFFIQKDYFLHESKVYAHRISVQQPCLDGKTKRVANNIILFHEGKPIYRSHLVVRVPVSQAEPDLSKGREREVPLPPGLEGWQDRLTARAFNIARTFRPGIGRYAFGDWDAWLLRDAPPEGPIDVLDSDRDENWVPPEGTLVLPVHDSMSPDDLFEIGFGYEKGPVDWSALSFLEGQPTDKHRYPTFSTKLASGQLTPELEDYRNFLLNRVTGKPLVTLGIAYPGERQRFNHDELLVHWSPGSQCFVVRAEQKWFTEYAEVGWIKEGRCEASYDVLQPLQKAALDAVLKTKHPAAKRLRVEGTDDDGYAFSIVKMLVEDSGAFEVHVVGQIPKDTEPSGSYEVIIEGVFSPGEKDSPARLKVTKTRVLPPHKEEEN